MLATGLVITVGSLLACSVWDLDLSLQILFSEHRQAIVLVRQEGLTKTYNRFHNPQESSADIVKLRELHKEMDQAVAAAYGWQDLELEHGFHETKQGMRYTITAQGTRSLAEAEP